LKKTLAVRLGLVALSAALPAVAAYLTDHAVFGPAVTGAVVMGLRLGDKVVEELRHKEEKNG
jgi:hypothetical protein